MESFSGELAPSKRIAVVESTHLRWRAVFGECAIGIVLSDSSPAADSAPRDFLDSQSFAELDVVGSIHRSIRAVDRRLAGRINRIRHHIFLLRFYGGMAGVQFAGGCGCLAALYILESSAPLPAAVDSYDGHNRRSICDAGSCGSS